MRRHGRALRETLLADGAAEWLLSTVRPEVRCEVRSLSECLSADLTSVGFLAAVGAHVGLERGGTGVALATHLAHVAAGLARSPLRLGGGRMVLAD